MKQNSSDKAAKAARRGLGQAIAAVVMALAVAVGGVGTTALLAAQPMGLTVEPSVLQWDGVDTRSELKEEPQNPTGQAPAEQPEPAVPESQEAAQPEAPGGKTEVTQQPETVPESAPLPEQTAPADPMAGAMGTLDDENGVVLFCEETDVLAAEDPLRHRVETLSAAQGTTQAQINSAEEALEQAQIRDENGTVLLTPEEIRAALDAGTLDESGIDPNCLDDENGLLHWLWSWLFRGWHRYSGWHTENGKTYYYDENTHRPLTGVQSIDNKLYYFDEDGVQQQATFGIDVSKYQSKIDFAKAKKAGVEFVIIRIGYRGYGSGTLVLDPMFEQHFTNARNAGLRVGVYFFSQAVNEAEAREEAQGCWYVLNGRALDYPIYFDTEASGASNGRADGLGVEDRTKCAVAFCEEVRALGYQPGVYASTNWFRQRLDMSQLSGYSIWNAHYNVASSPIDCDLWQGSCTARIAGYSGELDVNISYCG